MTGFSAEWLRLREPHDHAARDVASRTLALPQHVQRWRAAGPVDQVLNVIDLACGSGANLRELAPRLGGTQRWRLLDHDPALLAALPLALAEWAHHHGHRSSTLGDGTLAIAGQGFSAEIMPVRVDLARDLAAVDCKSAHLVTASALLDLVSEAWIDALIRQVQHASCALLFALNVDGTSVWDPSDAGDEVVHDLFTRHQARDKGFGPSLGPRAVEAAGQRLSRAGYQVQQARSDWLIDGAQHAAMQTAMIEGIADAAAEQDPDMHGALAQWKKRRLALLGATRLQVGHVDLLATPG